MPTASSPREDATATSLPYDPEEWQRRLAAARAQREKVLQARATRQQHTADDLLSLTTRASAIPPSTLNPPVDASAAALSGSGPRAVAVEPQPAPGSAPTDRLRPALFGLVVGAVAGTALAGFGGVGEGMGALLQSRLMSFSPFAAPPAPIVDAAPVLTATLPRVPAVSPPGRSGPRPLPNAIREAIAVSLVPLVPPAVAETNAPVIPAAVLVTGPSPPVPAPPSSRELARPSARPDILSSVLETPRGSAHRPFPAFPPRLVVPEKKEAPASGIRTAAPPRVQAVQVVVHVPERMEPDQRQSALASLADSGWPAETAVNSPYTISETHVRYYHPHERAAARELAELFGASARDFTSYSPSPERGLMELWLAGQGTPRQARPVRTRTVAERATTSSPNLFTRIAGAIEGTSTAGPGRNRRVESAGGPYASQRSGAVSASRPATADRGRSASGGGRQTGADADSRDRSSGSAASASQGASNDRTGNSTSDSGARGGNGGSGSDAGRGNNGGRGKGGDRGNGGGRGGSAADTNGGGKGNGSDNGRGHGGGRGGGSDRDGDSKGGGGKSGRGR